MRIRNCSRQYVTRLAFIACYVLLVKLGASAMLACAAAALTKQSFISSARARACVFVSERPFQFLSKNNTHFAC